MPKPPMLDAFARKFTAVKPTSIKTHSPDAPRNRPDQIIAETKAVADAGNADAMFDYALALEKCAKADKGSDAQIEDRVAKESLLLEDTMHKIGAPSARLPAGYAAKRATDMKTIRDSCTNVPAERAATWRGQLERAAAAGSNAAREEYARSVLDDFPTQKERVASYEEYDRSQKLAYGYLQDELADGQCTATALNYLPKLSPDPTSTYVYWSILLRYGLNALPHADWSPEKNESERASLEAMLTMHASGVPADQLDAANATIDYMMQGVCSQIR